MAECPFVQQLKLLFPNGEYMYKPDHDICAIIVVDKTVKYNRGTKGYPGVWYSTVDGHSLMGVFVTNHSFLAVKYTRCTAEVATRIRMKWLKKRGLPLA